MQKWLFATTAACLLAGCAGEAEMRSVSSQTAQILTTYKSSLQEFAASQTALNAASVGRLHRLNQMAEMRRSETSARVDSWRLFNDEEALRQFEVVGSTSADQVLANANPKLPPPGMAPLKFEPAEVDALTKSLVELTKPVSPKNRVEQLIAYGTAVRDTYEKDLAAAAAASTSVASTTTTHAGNEESAQARQDRAQAGQDGAPQ